MMTETTTSSELAVGSARLGHVNPSSSLPSAEELAELAVGSVRLGHVNPSSSLPSAEELAELEVA